MRRPARWLLPAACALAFGVATANPTPADFVDKAKAYLVRNFNDPDSAHYRDLYIGSDEDGSPILCGEVVARNSNGGMSGYRAFFSRPGDDRLAGSKVSRVPREFLTIRNVDPDYLIQERDRCRKPGKPVP